MRRGFTLVELLAVIAIIGILAGISLAALNGAAESGRERRTQALIKRLDQAIMVRWDSYRTRRVPIHSIDSDTIDTDGAGPDERTEQAMAAAGLDENNTTHRTAFRTLVLRELMRYELPDAFEDFADLSVTPAAERTPTSLEQAPSLAISYTRRYNAASPSPEFESAECLYMIVASGHEEEASPLDDFRASDTGDFDGDGLREFHDSWGRPISFLRWAPGFISDLQPATGQGPDSEWGVAGTDDDGNGTTDDASEAGEGDDVILTSPVDEPIVRDSENNHDPFDPLRVFAGAWRLAPLIYAAGRDGGSWTPGSTSPVSPYDLVTDATAVPNDPYSMAGSYLRGQPFDIAPPSPMSPDGEINAMDNITNHQIGQWTR